MCKSKNGDTDTVQQPCCDKIKEGNRVEHTTRGLGTVETMFAKGSNPNSKTIFVNWDDGSSFLYNEKEIKSHNVQADRPDGAKGERSKMNNETKKTLDDPLASERSSAPLGTCPASCSPHSKIGRIFEAEESLSQAIIEMCANKTELSPSVHEKIGHAACLLSNYCALNNVGANA